MTCHIHNGLFLCGYCEGQGSPVCAEYGGWWDAGKHPKTGEPQYQWRKCEAKAAPANTEPQLQLL